MGLDESGGAREPAPKLRRIRVTYVDGTRQVEWVDDVVDSFVDPGSGGLVIKRHGTELWINLSIIADIHNCPMLEKKETAIPLKPRTVW